MAALKTEIIEQSHEGDNDRAAVIEDVENVPEGPKKNKKKKKKSQLSKWYLCQIARRAFVIEMINL